MKHEAIKSLKPGTLLRCKDAESSWIVEHTKSNRRVEVINVGDILMFVEWPSQEKSLFYRYEGAYFLIREKLVWLHFTQLYSLEEIKK